MAINANYTQPVTVNGYSCRTGTEVDLAAKRIDPAHPKSGPDDIYADVDMTRPPADRARFAEDRAAVTIVEGAGYSPTGTVTGQAEPGAVVQITV